MDLLGTAEVLMLCGSNSGHRGTKQRASGGQGRGQPLTLAEPLSHVGLLTGAQSTSLKSVQSVLPSHACGSV